MTTPHSTEHPHNHLKSGELLLPAPTAWPIVLAFGFTLLFAGLLTSSSVSILGGILVLAGVVGWFREVFPHEREEVVSTVPDETVFTTARSVVDQLQIGPEHVRAWLPIETYPVSAGVKGGWAGSVAMAVLACAYGLIKTGSIWYPINLLAGIVYMHSNLSLAELEKFHLLNFLFALLLHGVVSTLVGLLYGAMLPMIPRHPILLGGLIAPALWTGLLYSFIGLINPLLESRIDWYWFAASQVAFGVVAGLVVMRHSRVPTSENLPFAVRAGIEAPGTMLDRTSGGKRP
jgi:hypothetical protein